MSWDEVLSSDSAGETDLPQVFKNPEVRNCLPNHRDPFIMSVGLRSRLYNPEHFTIATIHLIHVALHRLSKLRTCGVFIHLTLEVSQILYLGFKHHVQ